MTLFTDLCQVLMRCIAWQYLEQTFNSDGCGCQSVSVFVMLMLVWFGKHRTLPSRKMRFLNK